MAGAEGEGRCCYPPPWGRGSKDPHSGFLKDEVASAGDDLACSRVQWRKVPALKSNFNPGTGQRYCGALPGAAVGGSCSWLWLVPYVSPEVGSWGPARWVTGTWGHTSPAAPGQAGAGPHSHITWAGRVLGALVPTGAQGQSTEELATAGR